MIRKIFKKILTRVWKSNSLIERARYIFWFYHKIGICDGFQKLRVEHEYYLIGHFFKSGSIQRMFSSNFATYFCQIFDFKPIFMDLHFDYTILVLSTFSINLKGTPKMCLKCVDKDFETILVRRETFTECVVLYDYKKNIPIVIIELSNTFI